MRHILKQKHSSNLAAPYYYQLDIVDCIIYAYRNSGFNYAFLPLESEHLQLEISSYLRAQLQ